MAARGRRRVATVASVATATVAVAALLGACDRGGGSNAPRVERPAGTLAWQACGEGAECATLRVPASAGDADAATIPLALARRRAGDDSERLGVLLVNPGGPGAEARSLVHDHAGIFSDAVRDRYDLLAWDPRGTGGSAAVDCLDDHALDRFWAVDRSPDDARERGENRRAARALADGCADRSSALLAHVGTADTVGDMERVRVALGEERLNFLGFSYGTALGALYADRYPRRVGRFVLDGAVDLSRPPEQANREQALGFERALREFLAACAGDDECAFHSGGDPAAAFDRLMAAIDAEPAFARTHGELRELGPGELDLAVAGALYRGRDGWGALAEALRQAAAGDGTALLELSDAYTGRDAGGRYDGENEAFYAVSCFDAGPAVLSPAETEAAARRLQARAPHFGASTMWLGLPCAYWPARREQALTPRVRAEGSPPILVLATTRDPATPYAWGRSLADQLDRGVLVTRDGDGHTAYGEGNECIDRLVDAYLIDGTVPRPATRC